MALTVLLDGSQVICALTQDGESRVSVQQSVNGRSTAQVSFADIGRIAYAGEVPGGMKFRELTIRDGSTTIFAGIITAQDNYQPEPGQDDARLIDIRATDWGLILDRRTVRLSLSANQTLASVVAAIINHVAPDGDSAAAEGITAATMPSVTINSALLFDGVTISEALNQISSRIGYRWWIDSAKAINFANGGNNSPITINDFTAPVHNIRNLRTRQTTERFRNAQWLRRAADSVPRYTQEFNGDGSNRTFPLAFEPAEAPEITRRSLRYAQSSLIFSGNPSAGNTVTIDATTYTFRTTLAAAGDVLIGRNAADSARNLWMAINAYKSYEGYRFYPTAAHPTCQALYWGIGEVQVRFKDAPNGDGTAVSESSSALAWLHPALQGGLAGVADGQAVQEVGVAEDANWYWQRASTNITQDPDDAALDSTELIEVSYRALFSDWEYQSDTTSIGAVSRWESTADESDVLTGTETIRIIQNYLRRFGVLPTFVDFETDSAIEPQCPNIKPGQTQALSLEKHNLNSSGLITDVTRTWFYAGNQWHQRAQVSIIAYPGSLADEPWPSWWDWIVGDSGGAGSFSSSGGTTETGTAPGAGGGAPAAQEVASVALFLLTDGTSKWGVQYIIDWGAGRSTIARAEVRITGPAAAPFTQVFAVIDSIPPSGNTVEQTTVDWQRPVPGDPPEVFYIDVLVYNADNVPSPNPTQSGTITVTAQGIISTEIASVSAAAITGSISATQIGSVNAGAIQGFIVASQIQSVNAGTIQGLIAAGQIASVNAGVIQGSIVAGQIASITAGQITGVIVTNQLADQILNTQRLLASDIGIIRRVSSLPTLPNTNYPSGVTVLRTTDRKLYKNNGGTWTAVNPSDDITGTLTSTDIVSVNASSIVGLIIASQINSITAGQITGTIQASQIGTIQGSQIANISASTITIGQIQDSQIANIAAGKITAGTIAASITMTSPTIQVSGTGGAFTLEISASAGLVMVRSSPQRTLTLGSTFRVFETFNPGNATQMGPDSLTIFSGGLSKFTATPTSVDCPSVSINGFTTINSSGAYIIPNTEILNETWALSGVTVTKVFFIRDRFGNGYRIPLI